MDHAYFEALCALAASGQLMSAESAELREHSEYCSSCRDQLAEMAQLGAHLFCAHALCQPGMKMPKDTLERFVARANREGIALSPQPGRGSFNARTLAMPGLMAAFLLALLLVTRTLHFGAHMIPTQETAQLEASSPTESRTAPSSFAVGKERASRTAGRRESSRNEHKVSLPDTPRTRRSLPSPVDSSTLERNPIDFAMYSKNLVIYRHPSFAIGEFDQSLRLSHARLVVPGLAPTESVVFMKATPPQLLAECERRSFGAGWQQSNVAPDAAGVQSLRRDFDPSAYRAVSNPDLKANLPVFQFSPSARQ